MPTISVANADTKEEISDVSRGKGIITVSGATALTRYVCNADGSTDDRATVQAAMAAAIADMPVTVEFGPGHYSMAGGLEVQPDQGSKGLTVRGAGANSTRFIFDKGSALASGEYYMFRFQPSVTPTVGVYANYLHDIHVSGIGVYDNDPSAHSTGGTTEESHGIGLSYVVNGSVEDCAFDDIGDECVNLKDVFGGRVTDNSTIGSPSISGSGAINIATGCNSVIVTQNTIIGGSTPGTRSTVTGANGIQAEQISSANATDIVGLTITDNVISGVQDAGVSFNFADATNNSDMIDVKVENNNITDCIYGVYRTGAQGVAISWSISMNTIRDVDSSGISFTTAVDKMLNSAISFNVIENITVAPEHGISANGTGMNMSGNNIKNVDSYGIFVSDGQDVIIFGGIIDDCGGTTKGSIEGDDADNNILVDGVNIINSPSTTHVVRKVSEVRNCNIYQTTPVGGQLTLTHRIVGNTINGGILASSDGFIVSNNNVDSGGVNLGNDSIRTGASNGIISGNRVVNEGATRKGIDMEAGSSKNIITDNWLDVGIGIALSATSPDNIVSNNYIDGSTNGLTLASGATGTTMLGNKCVSAGTDASAYFADGHHPADKTEWEKYNFGTITALT